MVGKVLDKDFLWGFATASHSYQIEGAPEEDGRGPSIWDKFCKIPGKIAGASSGDVACDTYHRTGEDIALLKETGAKAYRFSISWSRVIPLGGRNDPINQAGLDFYVKFVDDLLAEGIIPMVTLFHWDLPNELDERYGGLLNKEEFVADYANYARVLFKAMPKVKHWITFNEPWCDGVYPWDPNDPLDVEAAERKLEFSISWFADPIYLGDYPASMRKQLGSRLPTFSSEDLALVKGSNDFYGMNHYTANYIKHKTTPADPNDFLGNLETLFESKSGDNIGPETQSFWLRPNPPAFRDLLLWISKRYGYPTVFCTENGTSLKGENDLPREQILDDEFRAEYFRGYIHALAEAVEQGAKIQGYMAWSLMDNFEWAEGYETRFGVTYVDYEGGQKRWLKKSAGVVGVEFKKYIKDE
ncbi:putative Beta-glucosidase 1A [Glarea lozoyensis 74030]|uniref:Putative Beta-glucosidase 1A n=1 Tax=Glarea lozoyensis (strain ATCC 74030 / MF5533) TaxID=1104152 RepID=H0EJW8_GLAL7|nr:putative Beta-glucosidase 1A [Glarea lozoyensis 74030]